MQVKIKNYLAIYNGGKSAGLIGVWVLVVIVVVALIGGGVVLIGSDQIGVENNVKSGVVGDTQLDVEVVGDKVSDFELEDYQGNLIRRDDFAGKPLVINTWASWCPFCVKELDDFVAAQRLLGDEVAVIAINRGESLQQAKEFTDERGVSEELVFLLDPTQSFYNDSGGFAMPETLFVNANGIIDFHKRGPMEAEEIVERATFLLR